MRLRTAIVLLCVVTLLGIGAAGASEVPTFESDPCPDIVPSSPRIECGTLEVPEDHAKPGGRSVTLQVAIIHPEVAAKSDATPLLFLSGGPGDDALSATQTIFEQGWVTDRDVIVMDLRGIATSRPNLGCPEVDAVNVYEARSDDPATRKRYLAAVKSCRQRLVAEGVNLKKYDYTQITADLVDLRRALHLDEWNVYGVSNGGRVALELVRRHPEGIRSLVFDSALPPQGNYYGELWPHAKRAFDVFFAACADDTRCSTAYPNLEDRFWKLLDSLRRDPVSVTVTNPTTDAPTKVVFDDILAFTVLRGALYDTALLPIIPGILDGLTRGEGYEFVATEVLRRVPSGTFYSLGENLSDNCREQVAYIAVNELPRQAKRMPKYRRAILAADDLMRDECRVWKVGKAPRSVTKPVRSGIPALVLVGSFDPVHPLSSAKAIAKGLRNSQLVELPGLGHSTMFDSECSRILMRAFLVDPTAPVDTSCVDGLGPPEFS